MLARLLDLNSKRAEEERLQGLEASARGKKGAPGKPRKKSKSSDELGLFDLEE